jgi:hypothetical protein
MGEILTALGYPNIAGFDASKGMDPTEESGDVLR